MNTMPVYDARDIKVSKPGTVFMQTTEWPSNLTGEEDIRAGIVGKKCTLDRVIKEMVRLGVENAVEEEFSFP